MYEINNIKLDVDDIEIATGDFLSVLKERLSKGEWESDEAKHLSLIPSDSTVLELGACIGYISCLTNSLLENKKNHVVLEANRNLIPCLRKNRKLNDCSFYIENSILTNDPSNKEISFYVDKRSILGSSQIQLDEHRIKDIQKIQTKTIENLEANYNLKFDALICDIEGGEYELFNNVITDNFIRGLKFISIEFHWVVPNSHEKYQNIVNKLKLFGFNIIKFNSPTGQKQIFCTKEKSK